MKCVFFKEIDGSNCDLLCGKRHALSNVAHRGRYDIENDIQTAKRKPTECMENYWKRPLFNPKKLRSHSWLNPCTRLCCECSTLFVVSHVPSTERVLGKKAFTWAFTLSCNTRTDIVMFSYSRRRFGDGFDRIPTVVRYVYCLWIYSHSAFRCQRVDANFSAKTVRVRSMVIDSTDGARDGRSSSDFARTIFK